MKKKIFNSILLGMCHLSTMILAEKLESPPPQIEINTNQKNSETNIKLEQYFAKIENIPIVSIEKLDDWNKRVEQLEEQIDDLEEVQELLENFRDYESLSKKYGNFLNIKNFFNKLPFDEKKLQQESEFDALTSSFENLHEMHHQVEHIQELKHEFKNKNELLEFLQSADSCELSHLKDSFEDAEITSNDTPFVESNFVKQLSELEIKVKSYFKK